MIWRRVISFAALILILTASTAPLVNATNYAIVAQGGHFNVTLRINAFQNLTDFPSYSPYPILNSSLAGQDLTGFATALQKALQAKVSTIGVTQSTLRVTSNNASTACSPTCALQWLNVTVGFQLAENAPVNAGVAKYDMSWKNVRLDDDLTVAGVGFNRIGARYLLQALFPMVTFSPTRTESVIVTVQNQRVDPTNYQSAVSPIVLLDLSLFDAPVQAWNFTRDLASATQTWTSPFNGGFVVSAVHRINEPEGSTNLPYLAGATISAQVTTPLGAFAQGNNLFLDQSGGLWEKISISTILALIVVWITALVVERKTAGPSWTRRKNRKR